MQANVTNIPDVSANPLDNDRESWMQGLVAALTVLPEALKAAMMKPNGPTEYESFTITLTENDLPVQLLGYDLSRVRALIRASTTDVFIGKSEQLSGGLGYAVTATTASSGDEVTTNDAIYVASRPSTPTGEQALVTVWVEKVAG